MVTRLSGSARKGKTPWLPLAFVWDVVYENSFQALKAKLVTAPVLAYADFCRHFVLEIDTSHQGLGVVLSQKQGGKLRPIAYVSRSLQRTERNMENYSSKNLPQLVYAYNTTVHNSTGMTLYFLMFGYEPKLPVDFVK